MRGGTAGCCRRRAVRSVSREELLAFSDCLERKRRVIGRRHAFPISARVLCGKSNHAHAASGDSGCQGSNLLVLALPVEISPPGHPEAAPRGAGILPASLKPAGWKPAPRTHDPNHAGKVRAARRGYSWRPDVSGRPSSRPRPGRAPRTLNQEFRLEAGSIPHPRGAGAGRAS